MCPGPQESQLVEKERERVDGLERNNANLKIQLMAEERARRAAEEQVRLMQLDRGKVEEMRAQGEGVLEAVRHFEKQFL